MYAFFVGLNTISPDELHRSMEEGTPITVIDVNSQQSWRNAHVAGALNLDPQQYTERDLPADKNAPLVFYCSNPMRTKAPRAARRAKNMGYANVRVMTAGISGWISKQLPTQPGTCRHAGLDF